MKKFILAFMLISFNAGANQAKLIGHYGDWSAFYQQNDINKTCYIVSSPILDEGKYGHRDNIYMTITSRPNENSYNVVNIKSGYQYKYGSNVTIKIGNTAIDKIFTEKDTAWSFNASVDKQIINAMKKGNKAYVYGTTQKDIKTKDTYSLSGFNQALQAMSATCK